MQLTMIRLDCSFPCISGAQVPRAGEGSGGFSLIELAVALFIITFVSAGATLFIVSLWGSVNDSTFRVNNISEAQKVSEGLENYLINATCVAPGPTPATLAGSPNSTAPLCGSILNGNNGNVITAGNGNSFYFWAPSTQGSNLYTQYEVQLALNAITGLPTNHYLEVTNRATGVNTYLGNFVSNVAFVYYLGASNCSGASIGAVVMPVPPATSTVESVGMTLTMQSSWNAPVSTYTTCIYMPNSTYS